jgi:hypothetical protein
VLVRINGAIIPEVAESVVDGFKEVTEYISQDAIIDVSFGGYHIISADLNPINMPRHIVDGIVHLPERVASAFDFVTNIL